MVKLTSALELGLRDAGRLKILPVEIGDPAFAQGVERPAAPTEWRGNAQPRDGCENIRAEHRRVPGNRRAPVVPDKDGLLFLLATATSATMSPT